VKKEWILNIATNRWGLNKKNSVGPVSEWIRECAPKTIDEWDRIYNVDFYIEIKSKFIGLQIKPISYSQTPEIHKWKEWLSRTHKNFEKKFGGKVFTIFSIKKGDRKDIYNKEVIGEIKSEIERLNKLQKE